jgi:pimeloyl-ACP methyl ester carboxylesterase
MRVTVVGDQSLYSLILIPGGPGISSSYLRTFDDLSKKYQLHFIDMCGTNETNFEPLTSDEISTKIADYAKRIGSNYFYIGHSYGGYLAAKTSLISNPKGLICISTPLSARAMNIAIKNYQNKKNHLLKEKEEAWLSTPSNDSFRSWLAEFGSLYFHTDKNNGKAILSNDITSYRYFLNNNSDIEQDHTLLKDLKTSTTPKIHIMGSHDLLLPIDALEEDNFDGNLKSVIINKAGHFPMIDNLQDSKEFTDNFILTTIKEDL